MTEPAIIQVPAVPGPATNSAELRAANVIFRLTPGRELVVGRHAEDGSYQPDIDLGDLVNGRTVSRHHARIFQRDDDWFMRVETGAANPTLVGGNPLAPGQEAALVHGQVLQLGAVAVAFHQSDPIQIVGPEQIEVTIEPGDAQVEPGSAMSGTLVVVNFTDHVDQFLVEVRGLPFDWYDIVLPHGVAVARAEVGLFQTRARSAPASDAVARFQLVFNPPRSWRSTAGSHPFTVRVTSQARPRLRRVISGMLTIDPFAGLTIEQRSMPPPVLRAEFSWAVHNTGNAPAAVTYQAASMGAAGAGLFLPTVQVPVPTVAVPGGLQQLAGPPPEKPPEENPDLRFTWVQPDAVIDAGGTHVARLAVAVKRRHWWGDPIAWRFAATATTGPPEAPASAFDYASITSPPLVPLWFQAIVKWFIARLTFLLPLLAVLILLWVFLLRPPEIKDFKLCQGTAEAVGDKECQEVAAHGITIGQQVHLRFAAQHATYINVDGSNFKGQSIELLKKGEVHGGQFTESPVRTTRYLFIAQNPIGMTANLDQTLVVNNPPAVESFAASSRRLPREGEPVVLAWRVSAPGESEPPKVKVTARTGAVVIAAAPTMDCAPNAEARERLLTCGAGPGELVDRPTSQETYYTLLVWNENGASQSEQIVVIDPPAVDALAANPNAVLAGRETRLQWTIRGATRITLRESPNENDPGGQERVLDPQLGEVVVRPNADTWYTLTAQNAGGQASKRIKVSTSRVQVQLAFRAEPDTVTRGEPAQLSYQAEGVAAVAIEPGIGVVPVGRGNAIVKPERDTEYRLVATTAEGQNVERTARVKVKPGPVTVDFFTAPSPSIEKGETTTLAYSVQNADQVVIRDAAGETVKEERPSPTPAPAPTRVPTPGPAGAAKGSDPAPTGPPPAILGSVDVAPEKTTIYVLTARNEAGQVTMPLTIEVRPAKPPTGAPAPGASGTAAGGAAPAGAPPAPAAPPAAAPGKPPPPPMVATAQAARPTQQTGR